MNKPLEQYLDEVRDGLSAMPLQRRNEELLEVRQHLESSIEAGMRDGVNEHEATQNALQHFGSATEVRRGLLRVWRRSQPWRDTPVGAFLIALITFFVLHKIGTLIFTDQWLSLVALAKQFLPLSSQAAGIVVGVGVLSTILGACLVGAITRRFSRAANVSWATLSVLLLPLITILLFVVASEQQIASVNLLGIMVRFETAGTGSQILTHSVSYYMWMPSLIALCCGVMVSRWMPRHEGKRRVMLDH